MMTSLLNSKIWAAFIVLFLLNFADAATTAIIVHNFGAEMEANPFVRRWIEVFGLPGIYMIKAIVVGFLWLVVSHVDEFYRNSRTHTMLTVGMWVANAPLAVIVACSTYFIFRTVL